MRKKLCELCSSNTILIGHSLDNDLRALKICHDKIIDTSVLYKTTLTTKISLKVLVKLYFNVDIQNDTNGHSSVEDAQSCIRLVSLKIKYGKNYNILNNKIQSYTGKAISTQLKEHNLKSFFILPQELLQLHNKYLISCDISICRNIKDIEEKYFIYIIE